MIAYSNMNSQYQQPVDWYQQQSHTHHGRLLSASKCLNCFQYCSKALRVLGHVMVLLVLALVSLTYYTIWAIYGPIIFNGSHLQSAATIVLMVAYTSVVIMLLWCYFAAVLVDPGKVPPGWHPFANELQARHEIERMGYSDYYFDRRDPRRPRYCKRCQAWKPERTHHCSVLGFCVLKMDHYCIWVVNCVGLLNYKAFLLFLFYTLVSTLGAVVLLIRPLIDFFSDRFHGPAAPLIFLAVATDGAFAASITGFLIMHGQLVSANCTTIEMYEKDRIHPWPYNKGFRKNFEEVFGRNKLRWFIPYYTKEEKKQLLDSCLNPRISSSPFVSPPI